VNDATIAATPTAATADLLRLKPIVRQRLTAIEDAMEGWPAGKGFDTPTSRANVTFCEEHEKERCDCGQGTTYAVATDTTGDAALRTDRAKTDRDQIEKLTKSIRRQADELANLLGRYAPREATEGERRSTTNDNERTTACWSCARTEAARGVKRWEPSSRTATVDGDKRELCWWCFDWLRKGTTPTLPTIAQVEQHHRGMRVKRPA
jgi:hypothetical protein